MKLFISQPMKDKTNEEIEAERAAVVRLFDFPGLDVEVINSFFQGRTCTGCPVVVSRRVH